MFRLQFGPTYISWENGFKREQQTSSMIVSRI